MLRRNWRGLRRYLFVFSFNGHFCGRQSAAISTPPPPTMACVGDGVASCRRGPWHMALDPKAEAAFALHRFGTGPRTGSVAAIAADPRGALLAELDHPGAGRITNPDLPTSAGAARAA